MVKKTIYIGIYMNYYKLINVEGTPTEIYIDKTCKIGYLSGGWRAKYISQQHCIFKVTLDEGEHEVNLLGNFNMWCVGIKIWDENLNLIKNVKLCFDKPVNEFTVEFKV